MTPKDVSDIVAEIERLKPHLNDWEKNFIKDMKNRPFSPTRKQEKALLTIYEKAAGGGPYQDRQYGRR